MSLPIIVGAAGLAALLFAGSQEKSPAPSADGGGTAGAGPASPTQASTGGAQGGAQMPSHSDVTAADEQGTVPTDADTITAEPVADPYPAEPIADPGPSGSTSSGALNTSPTIATAGDAVGAGGGALLGSQFGTIANATTRTIGTAFETWGSALGAIW